MPPKGSKNKNGAASVQDVDALLAEAIAANQAIAGGLAAQRLQAETEQAAQGGKQEVNKKEVRMCCAFPDCQKENADKWCGGCKSVKYCDAACQGGHLKAHKAICKIKAGKDWGSTMSHAKKVVVDGVGPVSDRLWHACKVGRLTDVERLIAEGGDVNDASSEGTTCLGTACNGGHVQVAALLLSRGARVNQMDIHGYGPLMVAAIIGNSPLVSLLLDKGALVDAADNDGFTPLSLAAGLGHTAIVKQLLLAGADPVHRDNDDLTPLDYAIASNHPEVVALLEARP